MMLTPEQAKILAGMLDLYSRNIPVEYLPNPEEFDDPTTAPDSNWYPVEGYAHSWREWYFYRRCKPTPFLSLGEDEDLVPVDF